MRNFLGFSGIAALTIGMHLAVTGSAIAAPASMLEVSAARQSLQPYVTRNTLQQSTKPTPATKGEDYEPPVEDGPTYSQGSGTR